VHDEQVSAAREVDEPREEADADAARRRVVGEADDDGARLARRAVVRLDDCGEDVVVGSPASASVVTAAIGTPIGVAPLKSTA